MTDRPGRRGGQHPAEGGRVLRVTLELDRQAAEVLRLELRRLARRHGVDPDTIRCEIVPAPPEPST